MTTIKKQIRNPNNIKRIKSPKERNIERFKGKIYSKRLNMLFLCLYKLIYIKTMCTLVIYTAKVDTLVIYIAKLSALVIYIAKFSAIILLFYINIVLNTIQIISFFEFRNNRNNTYYKGYSFINLKLSYFFKNVNGNLLPTTLYRKFYLFKFLDKKVVITFDREKSIEKLYINIPRFYYNDINYYFKLEKKNLNDIDIIMLKEYIYRLILSLHKKYDKNFIYLKTLIYTKISDEKERVFDLPIYCYSTDTLQQRNYCNKLFSAISKIIFDEYYIYVQSSYIVFHVICKKDVKKILKFSTFKLKRKDLMNHLKEHFKFNENDYEIQ